MNIKDRVEEFRYKLQTTIDATRQENPMIASCCRALLADFNMLFSPALFSDDQTQIALLAERHCVKDKTKCPICGSDTVRRKSKIKKRGSPYFLGCSRFPACKGARSHQGNISINDALREFLVQKEYDDTVKQLDESLERFGNL